MASLDKHADIAALEATEEFTPTEIDQLRKFIVDQSEAVSITMNPRDKRKGALIAAAISANQSAESTGIFSMSKRQAQQKMAEIQRAQVVLNTIVNATANQ